MRNRIQFIIASCLFFSYSLNADTFIKTSSESFSPNWDGRNDTVEFRISKSALPRLFDWELVVKNAGDDIVKTFRADHRRKRGFSLLPFLQDENTLSPLEITIPESILWSGEDSKGFLLPDGEYKYRLRLVTENKENLLSEEKSILLDSHPPNSELGSKTRVLFLTGDRSSSRINISQKAIGESGDNFTGEFLNSEGKVVKSYSWKYKEVPSNLSWDGTDYSNKQLPSGIYSYRLTAFDKGKNESITLLNDLTIRNETSGVDLYSDSKLYSYLPGSVKNSIRFHTFISPKIKSDSYEIEIFQKNGNEEKNVYRLRDTGEPSPEWRWDLRNQAGDFISSGIYHYRLTIHSRYERYQSFPSFFQITKDSFELSVSVSPKEFTPDNDGKNDVLKISLDAQGIPLQFWEITLYETPPYTGLKKKIKTWSGNGAPCQEIHWEGLDETGVRVGSLSDFYFDWKFTDVLGRESSGSGAEFKTGILVLEEDSHLRISIPESQVEARWWSLPGKVRSLLNEFPGYKIEVQSHSSHQGDEEVNQVTTEERARIASEYFFSKSVPFGRIRFRGYGETLPLIPGSGKYEADKNQRIDFYLSPQ
ncbi:OmpA family protein [Leptospira sp. 201903070]|uniref:OmpA family protein n=1 Tax=Leptospira ainlahdjerensis TaxID=2810033 RepID=A0ABS2UHE7_9LEPT|nr:FlgD immunoglobulin-like domain containing protein [Leptospira ainlahdjerensis]MBM9579358.1 OmpA family protein [Leptospira ainlahdjerensis]